MDDIEAVLDRADHYRFSEEPDKVPLNRISALPQSKKRLKKAILERVAFLIESYASLATFVPDECIDWLQDNPKPEKARKVYLKVFENVQKLRQEALNEIK